MIIPVHMKLYQDKYVEFHFVDLVLVTDRLRINYMTKYVSIFLQRGSLFHIRLILTGCYQYLNRCSS